MKVVSSKKGSMRERVDAQVDLLPVANWRVNDGGRFAVLSSRWSSAPADRTTELWLTEDEAAGIAKLYLEHLFAEAAKHGSRP